MISKKSSVFHRIILSYIVLLIIAVLMISGIAYYKTYSIVYDNIQAANLAGVEKLKANMSAMLQETDSVSLSLQGWPAIKKLFTMTGEIDTSWVSNEELFNLVYVLRKHKALHSYIDNIAIVFRDIDLVVDCTSPAASYADFFEYRFSFESGLFNGIDDLDFTKDSLLIPHCKVGKYTQPNQDMLVYFKAIPNASGTAKAMLLVTLKPDSLISQLNTSMVFDDGTWLITGPNQEVILSNRTISGDQKLDLPVPKEEARHTGYAVWDGKRCAYYYLYSQSLDQNFYIFFNLDNILRQFVGVILFMVFSLFITIGIGILLAFYYARKSYAPIRKLADSVPVPEAGSGVMDEYSLIEESLNHLTSENNVLKKSIAAHMPVIRNNLLNGLITNASFSPADRAGLEKYSIVFPHPYFFICVISIELMNRTSEESLADSPATNALFFSYIEEYFAGQKDLYYLAETNNGAYALVVNSFRSDLKTFEPAFAQLPGFIRSKLSKELEVDISMGISSLKQEPKNFKQLYYQAQHSLEYRYTATSCELVWYDSLNEKQKVSYNFTFNDELKLINLLKSGQKEEALSFTDSVLDDFFAQGRVKREDAVYIFNQILFCCDKVIHELQQRVSDAVDFKKLLSLNLFTQMNEYTMECVSLTCDIALNRQNNTENGLSERIVRYIREHFSNCDLTLTFLADEFHVSAIYVSKSVKKVSGISFIDYLNRLRIDEAKRILSETDESVRDIAGEIGYDSDKNFIRVFKKYEGVTPGQFRKMNRDKALNS